MGFLDRFLKGKDQKTVPIKAQEQAVLIHIQTDDLESSFIVEERLMELLEGTGVGEVDGNEIGGGTLVIFLYGRDAELLFKTIEQTLRESEFCAGARVFIRWGGPGAPQREVIL